MDEKKFDKSVTQVPFETEGTPWIGDDVRLYRLAESVIGPFGEEADYIMASSVRAKGGDPQNVVVVPVTEDGEIASVFMPPFTADDTSIEEALEALGFEDVTSA